MLAALKRLSFWLLPPIFLGVMLVLSEYQNNLSEVYPSELWVPLLAALIIGLLPALLYRWLMPPASRLAPLLASLLAAAGLYNFDTQLSNLGNSLRYVHIYTPDWFGVTLFLGLLAGLAGGMGMAAEWLLRRFKLNPTDAAKFLIIMATVAFLYSAATTTLKIAALWPQLTPVPAPKIAAPASSKTPAAKPDIYYLVLEDYASNPTLKALYGYDNSPFLDALTAKGFTVNDNAFSNYPYTSDSLPSTLQMNYLTNVSAQFKSATSTELPMRAIFDHPPVADELQKAGYKYLNVGSWWSDTRSIPAADTNYAKLFQVHIFGFTATLSEFDINILDHSFFGRLLNVNNSDAAHIAAYQLATLHQLAQAPAQGGRFIFGHIILPHAPYVFTADGSTPTYSQFGDDTGVTEEQKYVNQLRYINGQVDSLIADIQQHAATPPVIILQSDEGPHPSELEHNDDELADFDLNTLSDQKLRQKYGVLAAYYLPGVAPAAAEITSPVNAFRVVLNQYLGYNLDLLPDCSYAMRARDKVFDFVDVTARLHGAPADPRCAEIHK